MALSRHHAAFSRPLNVEEIVKEAVNFEFIPTRSLQQWLRAARMLLTEAAACEQDGNIQNAYLYLYRHCELVLSKFPTHPSYKDPHYKRELSQAQKDVKKNFAKLEQWKPRINQEHQRYAKAMERRNAERQRVQDEFNDAARKRVSFDQPRRGSLASLGSVPPSPTQALNANDNRDFAVELAQREIRRRDATRPSTRQAGISPSTVAARRQGFVAQEYEDQLDDGVQEAGRHLNRHTYQGQNNATYSQQAASSSYRYPTVPQKEGRVDWSMPPMPSHSQLRHTLPPSLPAKEPLYDYQTTELAAPALPPKHTYDTSGLSTPARSPSPPQSTSKVTFKPGAYTESGSPLRTVMLPPDLRNAFLNLAHPNTLRNLETCGILCATIISNALVINHLIIPDQTSTSDTCDTTESGDNDLFDYCDSHNLLVCGWIHTHPSQTCFLSSRDLHTSSGYQVMLPEAIAIVCSPRHMPDYGIFRLTDPPGLEHVLNCTQSGLFHPHSESNLYTDAVRPGHVLEGPGLPFEVVDLRK